VGLTRRSKEDDVADRLPLDFDPPASQLRALLLGVDDDEMTAPTPCDEWTVAALLDHLMVLSLAFTQAARKRTDAPGAGGPPPPPTAQHLSRHWRSRLPVLLEDLAAAWQDPAAWTGTATTGGATMPATTVGTIAMNELIMHGWDLARATGQDYAADPRTLEVLVEFLAGSPSGNGAGFVGPAIAADPEESLLEQALALAGRRANWRPPRHQSRPASAA
jgi:uncharacterized protein (TIGR03086 family)